MWVYVHQFPNGKRYVGQTIQKPTKRWGKNGDRYKSSPCVFNAIMKYGWDNTTHTVYEVETMEEMDYLEKYLISFYNTRDRRFGYNLDSGGNANKNRSEETKDKISTSLKGKNTGEDNPMYGTHRSEEFKQKMSSLYGTAVHQFNLNDELIAVYASISEAAKAIDGCKSSIARALKRENNLYKGFKWKN